MGQAVCLLFATGAVCFGDDSEVVGCGQLCKLVEFLFLPTGVRANEPLGVPCCASEGAVVWVLVAAAALTGGGLRVVRWAFSLPFVVLRPVLASCGFVVACDVGAVAIAVFVVVVVVVIAGYVVVAGVAVVLGWPVIGVVVAVATIVNGVDIKNKDMRSGVDFFVVSITRCHMCGVVVKVVHRIRCVV